MVLRVYLSFDGSLVFTMLYVQNKFWCFPGAGVFISRAHAFQVTPSVVINCELYGCCGPQPCSRKDNSLKTLAPTIYVPT